VKLDVNAPMTALNGVQLKNTPDEVDAEGKVVKEGEKLFLADVLIAAALTANRNPNKPYKPQQQVVRYALALDTHKAREAHDRGNGTGIIEISPRVIRLIEDDISHIFSTIVAGQVLMLAGMDPVEALEQIEEMDRRPILEAGRGAR
jgi:hypothetical protein